MAKAYEITEEISNKIRMIRETIKSKSEDTRLHALELRGLGKKNKEIAEILDVHEKVVSKWASIFANQGIQGLMNKPKGGLLSTNEIKQEYIKLVGIADI